MPGQSEAERNLSLPAKLLLSGFAASTAELFTLPFDTVKVRMQVYKYNGPIDCVSKLLAEGGPLIFWNGLAPGLQRQMVFAPLRLSLYPVFSQYIAHITGYDRPRLWHEVLGGMLSGAFAISIANPADLIKTRMQADMKKAPGEPKRYNGVVDAYRKIYRTEGIPAFWTAWFPNVCRNSVINASEVVSYYQAKTFLIENNIMKEGFPLHFVASAFAGVVAVICGNPIDVMKQRVSSGKRLDDGTYQKYKGLGDCFMSTLKEKGPMGFYHGVISNALRLISWNIIMFVSREQYYNLYYNSSKAK
jgi:solute carrier family 25 (mitochondrial uncoupling protein), member 8/9